MQKKITKEIIDNLIHSKLEAILGFAMKRTFNKQDAEDLVQEIVMQIYMSYKSIKNIECLEALEGWMWAVSKHTYFKWLTRKNKDNIIYIEGTFEEPESSLNIEDDIILKEDIKKLKFEINLLSENYRNILVMFYLKSKSLKDISKELDIPLTSVKWRLHEAKKIIKERMNYMDNSKKDSLIYKNLWFSTSGTFSKRFSNEYTLNIIKSSLRQNILLAAYRKPLSIPEISEKLGVPKAYIEDDVSCLVDEGFIKKSGRSKYQTDFLIITKDFSNIITPKLKASAEISAENFISFVPEIELNLRKMDFVGSDKPLDDILWLAACCYASYQDENLKNISKDTISLPMKPHGNVWALMAFEGSIKEYPWCGDLTRSQFEGIGFMQEIYSTNALTKRAGFLDKSEALFYKNLVVKKVSPSDLNNGGEEVAARLIARGFISKNGNFLKPNMICFTKKQFETFKHFISSLFKDLTFYNDLFDYILKNLKGYTPAFLDEYLSLYTKLILENYVPGLTLKYLIDKNILKMPQNLQNSIKGMYAVYEK